MWTHLFSDFCGVVLASFEKQTVFTEERRQSQGLGKSKKQVYNSTNGTTKPETQWFCENTPQAFTKQKRAKQSAAVFLMSVGR